MSRDQRWSAGIVSSIDIAGIPEMCNVRIRYAGCADFLIEISKNDAGEWIPKLTNLRPAPPAS